MTGKPMIDKIFILLLLITTGGALGVYVYTEFVYSKPLPNDAVEFTKLKEMSKLGSIPNVYKLQKMTVNLKSRTSKLRFIDLEMYLVPFNSGDRETIDLNKEKIYDSIIDITSGMDPDDLNTVSGKILLENRIKSHLNSSIRKKLIKEILFSVFVII